MGRHTKFADETEPFTEPPAKRRRLGWLLSLPLLPITALIVAVGVIVAAISTSQISLNFAGGAPVQNQPQADAQDSGSRNDQRASRKSREGVVVAFRSVKRLDTGFRGTVTIANHGAKPVDAWTLAFKIPNAQVLSVSNAVLVRTGTVATLRGSAIPAGESVRVAFVARGAASSPSACLLNRIRCTLA